MVQESEQADAAAMDSSSGWAVAPAVSAAAPTMPIGGILTMAGIFLVFLTFALALIFLQYYFNTSVRTAPRGRPRGVRGAASGGVDPELLRSLPVTVYRAGPKGSTDDVGVECAVCLTELEDGEEARFLPRCGHGFHTECVDMWLASHTSCPLCRATVGKPDASQALTPTSLPSLPPEPVNYAGNLPASVLLGVSDQATLAAVTVTSHGGHSSPSALATAAVLVIDIPDSRTVATPRGASKSPGLARLRSLKRLWSFGRQGPSGSTPPCSGGSGSGTADTDQGISITCATPRAPV
ncbi:hypothetical protein CFC21_110184 [Triticum aestivum]|uniref:RING-type E3 ubiquitin transferase n=3 Tax=Triticinae TaxID=1648030 RepID=A0A453SER0_AEGTS|nr:E3 ubiquitin-protein ligase EL5 [Aegilops tauschii subsp. strangulata]XP_044440972.1 E3 ubiquitin-protein ligase EL5-like [Triticum aestivum]KAF7110016.1 hypothetical protein CFC21_110184 [Triticum aestivum]